MPSYEVMLVDAFTATPLEGNACAVVFGADGLEANRMLAVAREMGQPETAFVMASAVADFGARYFTPSEEIPLAGHPTIATVWALLERGDLDASATVVTLELVEGPITVDVARAGERRVLVMTQRRPVLARRHDPADVLPAFGLEPGDALPGAPIRTVSTGTPQLMVPLRDLETLRRATLDIARYRRLREADDFFSPHLFCLEAPGADATTFARHFGLPPDVLEDPFTGSATGAMAAYLWHHGLIEAPRFIAEQGHWLGRPGRAQVEVVGPREAIETVRVSGTAVTVLRGELTI